MSWGGLGIRAAEDHGAAAHAASLLSTKQLIQDMLHQAGEEDSTATLPSDPLQLLSTKQGKEATNQSLEGQSQKLMSTTIDLHNLSLLVNHYGEQSLQRELARINCLGLAHAGDWLNVVPSPSLGPHLQVLEFTVVVKYRLGMKIYDREGECPACGY